MNATVRMKGVSQRFGVVQALDSVDFDAAEGRIHALVGENGAGKTTLMKVLYGALRPQAGTVELNGQPVQFRRPNDAIRSGIGMVSQHYSIIPELTCLQNLMLGAEPGWVVPIRKARERAQELAVRMGFQFDWSRPASTLSPAGAQKLEILKLLWRESRVLILDEPTAMLSPTDSEQLYMSLKALAGEAATVIVVTHRLSEVMSHCDDVTVLRAGKRMSTGLVSDTTASQLAEAIVGHPIGEFETQPFQPGRPVLTVKGLVVKGHRGDEAVKGVDLQVLEGEVLGIAGVDGSGQRELIHALMGVKPALRGSIDLDGEPIEQLSPSQRLEKGLRLIPEDRLGEGVVEDWSLEENAALGLQRMRPLSHRGFVVSAGRKSFAERVAARFQTKHAGLNQPLTSLSGGNQQRLVAARALTLRPRLILAFQPARGLDIDGAAAVYQAIASECRAGATAVVISFDLDELLQYCDRVVAMYHGKLFEPAPAEARDRLAIGRLMVGAKP